MSVKTKTARLSIISNSCLIVMKLIVGILTGSVSIISEAIHSTTDLVAALVAYVSVRISDKPADAEHPYGHGKVENISGVIEALLILGAAAAIIVEAIKKLIMPTPVDSIGLGFLVMIISSGVNLIVSKKLYKVAKEYESVAIEADALHLKVDVYTSLGVGFGLLLMWFTGIEFLDPVVAILVAIFILKEAIEMLINAFNPLLDGKLEDKEIEQITKIMTKYEYWHCDYHDLRTRRAGSQKYIEMHLVFPDNMTVKEAHAVCDKIEGEMEEKLRHTSVTIHMESCENKCDISNLCLKQNTNK